jgi:hypothetical protein
MPSCFTTRQEEAGSERNCSRSGGRTGFGSMFKFAFAHYHEVREVQLPEQFVAGIALQNF